MSAMDLSDRWPLPDSPDLRDEVAAAYADPARGYHDTRHLTEVLNRLDELSGAGTSFDATAVLLAAWFHDAVYDGERDAEERSATWAEDALAPVLPAPVVAEVARLVRLTETHQPDDADLNGCALSDADLAILAAPPERYDEYVAAVRREYAHLDDEVFGPGRASVLRALADKPHLFHTAYARERWEAPARANVERELAGLADGEFHRLAGETGAPPLKH
jgi:predicted metal-dependent HD superfamily phosphohydrolase